MTTSPPQAEHMHYANPVSAGRHQWHEHDLRRSAEFHAVLLAMASHDPRQHLQIILSTFGWLSARTADDIDRKRIARGQHAAMQIAEQLHQLVTALNIHQKPSQLVLVPVRLSFTIFGGSTVCLGIRIREGRSAASRSNASSSRKWASPTRKRHEQPRAQS
jgi:hypothetical protein